MRIRLIDPSRCKDLVRHFRGRGYLAVEREPGVVEVIPIDASDAAQDRERTLAELRAWARANPSETVTPLDD